MEKRYLWISQKKAFWQTFPMRPPTLAAVKVEERVSQTPSVLESLGTLKSEGYLIAVEEFSGNPACAPLYSLADILSIDVGPRGKEELFATIALARQYPAALMAKRVQDHAQFKTCQELGLHFFTAPFSNRRTR
jgi:c-di-GMP phosphodiesterase